MKVLIPYKVRDTGDASLESTRFWGPSTFAMRLKAGLEERGHSVIFEFTEEYDVLFVIVQCPWRFLRHAKMHKRPIVQRLDGVFYFSVSGWQFPLMNAKAALTRHLFTDFTVYQSEYSKYCVEKFLGTKRSERSAVIYNAVDLKLFSPRGAKHNLRDFPEQKVFFSASAFRRRDQIIPILQAVDIYREKYGRDCKLVLAGNFIGEVADIPHQHKRSKYIQFIGKVNNHKLPQYARAADIFVFSHLNPPCPNNVIEAMACGLPISGVADGSMKELVTVGTNGLLVPARGDAFWRRRVIDTETFADSLQKILQQKVRFGQISRKIAEERFSLDDMIARYITALEAA